MSKYEFSINLSAPPEQLIKIGQNYENFPNYLSNLKSVKIIEQNNNETIVEEIIAFSTFLKYIITQKTIHKKISDNKLYTQIISGPAKGTVINVFYEKIDSRTKVTINIDLKLGLKARILEPLFKKFYKIALTGILFKMNTAALEVQQN